MAYGLKNKAGKCVHVWMCLLLFYANPWIKNLLRRAFDFLYSFFLFKAKRLKRNKMIFFSIPSIYFIVTIQYKQYPSL